MPRAISGRPFSCWRRVRFPSRSTARCRPSAWRVARSAAWTSWVLACIHSADAAGVDVWCKAHTADRTAVRRYGALCETLLKNGRLGVKTRLGWFASPPLSPYTCAGAANGQVLLPLGEAGRTAGRGRRADGSGAFKGAKYNPSRHW
jgi:hypothetical protein